MIKQVLIIVLIITLLLTFLYWQNNGVQVSRHIIETDKINKSVSGFKILHLSDLHIKRSNRLMRNIVNIVINEKPDIIVITGDLIDRRSYNEKAALAFIKG